MRSSTTSLTGKLIAAPHDGWESWDSERIAEVMGLPWLTLRRLDHFTLRPFMQGQGGGRCPGEV